MKSPRAQLRRGLLTIFVVALAIRLLFVAAVLEAHEAPELRRLNGDSREYLRLGEHLVNTGQYVAEDDVELQAISLVRPPLYPAIIAAALKLENSEPVDMTGWHWSRVGPGGKTAIAGIFILQATADATLGVLAGLIAWQVWRRTLAAYVAASLMALCPTGWGLSAVVLADGLFAFLVGTALWLTLHAVRRRHRLPAILAGIAWSLAIPTKPTLLCWPFGLALFWYVAAVPRTAVRSDQTRKRSSLINAAICITIFLATIAAWSIHNKTTANVFTYSIVTERNLRFMFGPNVEVRAKLGQEPAQIVTERYYELGHQDLRWLAEPGMTPAEFVRRQREYVRLLLTQFPGLILRQYVRQIEDNITGHWDILVNQLPPKDSAEPVEIGGMGPGGRWTPLARTTFGPFFVAESFKPLRWLLFTLAATAPILPHVRPHHRRRFRLCLALWLTAGYFLLTAATTHSQGSRILYPAYLPAVVLIAGWANLRRRSPASVTARAGSVPDQVTAVP